MTSRVWLADAALRAGAAVSPVLGLDTGGQTASLGIVVEGEVRGATELRFSSHCAGLPEAAADLLAGLGLKFSDLAGIAVGIGPGSFTGLRIGLSYAKGIASAGAQKLAGVSSLDAMAMCVGAPASEELCCSLIDARRGEVYAALYRFSGDALERITGDLVIPLPELVSRLDRAVVFAGGEIAAQAAATAAARGVSARHHAEIAGRGGWIAALGAARIAAGDDAPIASLEPSYVRGPGILRGPGSMNQSGGTAESLEAVTESGEKANGKSRGRNDPALPEP